MGTKLEKHERRLKEDNILGYIEKDLKELEQSSKIMTYELEKQDGIIDEIKINIDNADNKIEHATFHVKQLVKKTSSNCFCITTICLSLIILVLIFLLINKY